MSETMVRASFLRPEDLALVRAEDRPEGRFGPMLDAMSAELRAFAAGFRDDPAELSDWGHRYFCPADGGRLLWELGSPKRHACVVCGRAYEGAPYDQVWTTFYRNEAFQALRKAAALHVLRGGPEWMAAFRKILGFYAENYGRFALHSKSRVVAELMPDGAGAGRLMPQGLNEAIVVVRAVQALEILGEDLDPGFRSLVEEGLLRPAAAILGPQANRVHNIPCWIDAALGCVGLYLGEDRLVSRALDGRKAGIQAQLRGGLTEDSLWFEGSIHYHYFALEAALTLLHAASRRGLRRPRAEAQLERALRAGHAIAFSSGRFPSPNDGWPDLAVKTYAHVYDLAAGLFGAGSEADLLRAALEADPCERTELPLSRPYYFRNALSLERLLFAPAEPPRPVPGPGAPAPLPPARQPYVCRGSCIGMLRRGGLEVFLKYGHNGPSHAHPDKMNLEVALAEGFLTRDLSNAGYGAPLCEAWHRSSPAHNTVVVDGRDHEGTERGRVLWFDRERLAARALDVYPGVHFQRTLAFLPGGFSDIFEAEAEGERVFDWFFHVEGELLSAPPSEPAELGYGGPYRLLESVRELRAGGELSLEFRVGGALAAFRAETAGLRAFLAESLDNPVSGRRRAIVLRARGRRAKFDTAWRFEGGQE